MLFVFTSLNEESSNRGISGNYFNQGYFLSILKVIQECNFFDLNNWGNEGNSK